MSKYVISVIYSSTMTRYDLVSLLFLLLLELFSELEEVSLWVLEELFGRASLEKAALVEHDNLITLDDSVQPVGDGQHGGTLELLAD